MCGSTALIECALLIAGSPDITDINTAICSCAIFDTGRKCVGRRGANVATTRFGCQTSILEAEEQEYLLVVEAAFDQKRALLRLVLDAITGLAFAGNVLGYSRDIGTCVAATS